MATTAARSIEELLGDEGEALLTHTCETIPRERITAPGPTWVDDVMTGSDRSVPVLRSLQTLFDHGRLGGTGYVSILPVDQGIEHSAAASFAPNPEFFDPVRIVELAIEGGCNAVASTLGTLGIASRRYAHRIPFMLKINHNEFLSYPNAYDQIMFGSVKQAWELGAVAVGATIYFGSPESKRQIVEVSQAFAAAHELGMATVLWCYMRNSAFSPKDGGPDYHVAADLTSQANHLGVTIEADIIKQKLPETAAPGFTDLKFGKTHPKADEATVGPSGPRARSRQSRTPLVASETETVARTVSSGRPRRATAAAGGVRSIRSVASWKPEPAVPSPATSRRSVCAPSGTAPIVRSATWEPAPGAAA